MKRCGLALLVFSVLAFLAFPPGFHKSHAQGLELFPNASTASDTNRTGAATESPLGPAPDFSLSGGKSSGSAQSLEVNPRGHVVLPRGRVYQGEVIGDVPYGNGTVTDLHGSHQQGQWVKGVPQRLSGTRVGADGTRAEGTWNYDGGPSSGTIDWPDGVIYKGEWKNTDAGIESPDGTGTMTWPDGRKYVGQFQDGRMEGKGVMKHPDGQVEDGLWKHGKFAGAVK